MSVSEHWERFGFGPKLAGAGRRVAADFRAFRVTPRGLVKWSAIVTAAFLFAALVVLYFLDWNQMRGPVGRYLSHRFGRDVRIEGNLRVDLFTLQPRVDVQGLAIGNPYGAAPGGANRPEAARVRNARVELRLVPLIFGHLVLPLVWIDHPDVLVVRDAGGRTNWDRSGGEAGGWNLPPIRRFLIDDGHVEIDDAIRKLKFTGTISSREDSGGGRAAFALAGDGALNANRFRAMVKGGPLLNVDETRPYDFTADIHAGETHALVTGALRQPFHLDRFTGSVDLTGPNLADLYYLVGLALPGTPPYELHAKLERSGRLYHLADLAGRLGNSDIAGDLSVDASGDVPFLKGDLKSRALDFDDLGALVGGGKSEPASSRFLLPETPLHTERLRQTDAEVDYSAATVHSRDFPLTGLATHISLQKGVLTLAPLVLGFTAGKLNGNLRIDARRGEPVTALDARLTDLHVEHFIQGGDKPVSGVLEARAQLTGTGNSVHKAASSAQGTFTVAVPHGQMRHRLAEWLGVNVISALGLTLAGDNGNTDLRCAVAHFTAQDGVLTARQFVFDTAPVRVDGGGSIDLKNETMDMTVQGKPKSFQLVRLRAPITIKGSLARPALGVDAKPLIAQGGIGAALAVVNPLAAILAFIDPGLAKDANCAGLLTAAKAEGAPVKAAASKRRVKANPRP